MTTLSKSDLIQLHVIRLGDLKLLKDGTGTEYIELLGMFNLVLEINYYFLFFFFWGGGDY